MKNKLPQSLAWKVLYRANGTLKVPFQLLLTDGNEPLYCDEVIRIIPGKRLVAFGTWGGKEVVIKLFYEKRRAKRNCERDQYGVETLLQANVPTPKMLYKGFSDKRRIYILVYEKITPAASLESLWQEKQDFAELVTLLSAVTIEIATQHVLGILQHDLHLKNFLITEKTIYTLDGGKISKFENPLDKKISLDYLCLFLAQLGVGYTKLQYDLFKIYTKSRGWVVKPRDIKTYKKLLLQRNQVRWERYKKKVFRSCSTFKRVDKITKSMIYDRNYESTEFVNLLRNPEKVFTQPSTTLLKAGRTSTVAKVTIDNKILVVKRYNIKDGWHAVRRCLRQTRAAKSWCLAQNIRAAGIPTAKPVAYIENKFLGIRGKSYFIMEYVPGIDIGDYFATYKAGDAQYAQMAKLVLELFNHLAELSITHGDLKKSNIIIENAHPVLIDLDGMREHRSQRFFQAAFKGEIKRFMKNWDNRPGVYALFASLIGENS